MGTTARAAVAALIRERVPVILPRVVATAAGGDASPNEIVDLERRLTIFLERRIPPWIEALEAESPVRTEAIQKLLRIDAEAGEQIPPVVLIGTVAIGYRVIEAEVRARAQDHGHSADELWAEVDLLRRTVLEVRRDFSDDGRVA